jgi:hypothetical protein
LDARGPLHLAQVLLQGTLHLADRGLGAVVLRVDPRLGLDVAVLLRLLLVEDGAEMLEQRRHGVAGEQAALRGGGDQTAQHGGHHGAFVEPAHRGEDRLEARQHVREVLDLAAVVDGRLVHDGSRVGVLALPRALLLQPVGMHPREEALEVRRVVAQGLAGALGGLGQRPHQLVDRSRAGTDLVRPEQGAAQPLLEQARAEGGLRAVDKRPQRPLLGAVVVVLQHLEVAQRHGVQHHVRGLVVGSRRRRGRRGGRR